MSANVSIFVPHAGCLHMCSFCDQISITNSAVLPHKDDVDRAVSVALSTLKNSCDAEIAFFGGSFTAIDEDYRLELLKAAYRYVESGDFKGIRISTRPDCIDVYILEQLKEYGVRSIELGAQSLDDDVLKKNHRGHTRDDVIAASNLIRQYGFDLGLQMMTGLYGSDASKDIDTARTIIDLHPDTVRIYPTITFENTLLAKLVREGKYIPPTLQETVTLCGELLMMFHSVGIKVIKLGLHAGDGVEGSYVAGPFHPAFRELCEGEIYLKKAFSVLERLTPSENVITLAVKPSCISKMIGQKSVNINKLRENGYNCRITEQPGVELFDVKVII